MRPKRYENAGKTSDSALALYRRHERLTAALELLSIAPASDPSCGALCAVKASFVQIHHDARSPSVESELTARPHQGSRCSLACHKLLRCCTSSRLHRVRDVHSPVISCFGAVRRHVYIASYTKGLWLRNLHLGATPSYICMASSLRDAVFSRETPLSPSFADDGILSR